MNCLVKCSKMCLLRDREKYPSHSPRNNLNHNLINRIDFVSLCVRVTLSFDENCRCCAQGFGVQCSEK